MGPQLNNPNKQLLEALPARVALAWGVCPLRRRLDGAVEIAAEASADRNLLDNLRALYQSPVALVETSKADVVSAIQRVYGVGATLLEYVRPAAADPVGSLEASESGVSKFVNALIERACLERATDIHFEPYKDRMVVRLRIDGLLHSVPVPGHLLRLHPLISSRIKVMAKMNIAERRLPQDGHIHFVYGEQAFDIRVSTLPLSHGEGINLRLLPRDRSALALSDLGMSPEVLESVRQIIRRSHGLLLVTGPTGHGKTTTLYGCLGEMNAGERKVITIEDPVEFQMAGINQIQVHPKIGLTFSHGLRAILRQDPDVIMVGEIRDRETADIAIRAALTGHLVLSTLHTNDAVAAVTRLVDMGIEPHLVASSVSAVMGQRLVRRVCGACAGASSAECEACRSSGFRGRLGLFEFLRIDDTFHSLIVQKAPASLLRKQAVHAGMRTLRGDGMSKTGLGLTTFQEVERVVDGI
jgi:type II secretory ATPase GspE/PulE/Tfp pilus assembly ATPase PilB-like protein